MKKVFAVVLSTILLSCSLLNSSVLADSAYDISLGGCGPGDEAYLVLQDEYPSIKINTSPNVYLSTNEIINAFLCGEFHFDTFVMNSSSFDYKKIIKKGYCENLIHSSYLNDKAPQLIPSVQQQIVKSDVLYGVPVYCDIQYYAYNPDAWDAAMLTKDDIPTSFEEFLDFLELWLERITDTPEYEISVSNSFDSELYGPHSYTLYLVDMLLNNHIMQCNYEGKPLRFDTPIFRSLLLRCQRIGEALYELEPREKGYFALFDVKHGMRDLSCMIPLRLTSDQPVLVKATLHTAFLNAKSEQKEIATKYLEYCLQYLDPEIAAYMFKDAQPIENLQYVQLLDMLQQSIHELKEKLDDENLTVIERNSLQEKLYEKETRWHQMAVSDDRYIISAKDLEFYQKYSECLYFQAPSVFDPSTAEGMNVRQLRDRFCKGDLPADQLIAELDNLSWMLEMENPD